MVPAGHQGGRTGGELPRARVHGHQAVGIHALGKHASRPRPHVPRHRPPERLFPPFHSQELPREGSPARGGIRQGMRGGDPLPARDGRGWQAAPGLPAGGAVDRPPDFRNHHRGDVFQVGPELPGPAHPHQPVGQCRPLGNADPPLPAHGGVPLAGGPHRPRHRGGGLEGDPPDARCLCRLCGKLHGHAGPQG